MKLAYYLICMHLLNFTVHYWKFSTFCDIKQIPKGRHVRPFARQQQ